MRPKIILRVGTEKTGTTSIQTLLNGSYNELLKSGVLFPRSIGSPCHINLTACALEKKPNSSCEWVIQTSKDCKDDNM